VQDSGATALERSLGALPEAIEQAGGLAVRTEELQAHRQRAFDTQNATQQKQEFRLTIQPAYEEWKQQDWQTLPERVQEEGRKMIQAHAAQLKTPYAKALFEADATQLLAVFQQQAIAERTKRTEGNTAFLLGREVQQAQEALAKATTPYEVLVAQGHLEATVTRFVDTGLMGGAEGATLLKKTTDAVQDERVQVAIQADAQRMKVQLETQSGNVLRGDDPATGTDPNLPLARPEALAKQSQQAREVARAQFAEKEHQERYADYQRQKQQTQNSGELLTRLYKTAPIPDNVPTFQRIIEDAAKAIETGALDPTTGAHIMSTAQTHATAAAKPPVQRDDPTVERTIAMAVYRAEAPQEFAQAREALTKAGVSQLTPETFGKLSDKLEQRERQAYWRARPAVQAGKDVILRGAVVPYGGSLAGIMKPKQQQKLLQAMDAYEQQIATLAEQDIREADKRAVDMAWNVRIQFMKPDKDDPAEEYLPPEAQAAKTPHELATVLQKYRAQGWADGTIAQILQNWHAWKDYETARQERAGGQRGSGTTPQPRSYQLPGTTPPSTTEPRSR
jgi:hypothetical protein